MKRTPRNAVKYVLGRQDPIYEAVCLYSSSVLKKSEGLVIDIGCGDYPMAFFLDAMGFSHSYTVGIDTVNLKNMERAPRSHYVQMDARRIPSCTLGSRLSIMCLTSGHFEQPDLSIMLRTLDSKYLVMTYLIGTGEWTDFGWNKRKFKMMTYNSVEYMNDILQDSGWVVQSWKGTKSHLEPFTTEVICIAKKANQ